MGYEYTADPAAPFDDVEEDYRDACAYDALREACERVADAQRAFRAADARRAAPITLAHALMEACADLSTHVQTIIKLIEDSDA